MLALLEEGSGFVEVRRRIDFLRRLQRWVAMQVGAEADDGATWRNCRGLLPDRPVELKSAEVRRCCRSR